MEKECIELDSYQITAYFWVNTIRNKVKEIFGYGVSEKLEEDFFSIFSELDEIGWRNLYLSLEKRIYDDVNSYVLKGKDCDIDMFSQDTDCKGHKHLNKELSLIMCKRVPDIRLAHNDSKDTVIYTSSNSVYVWYKSCDVSKLNNKYESTFILTGDMAKLYFYNLVLATFVSIKDIDKDFNQFNIFKDVFCEKYACENDVSTKQVLCMFNETMDLLLEREIVSVYQSTYFLSYNALDLVGIDDYLEKGGEFAKCVVGKYDFCRKKEMNLEK